MNESSQQEPIEATEEWLWALSHKCAHALSGEVRYCPGDQLAMANQRIARLEEALCLIQERLHVKLGVIEDD